VNVFTSMTTPSSRFAQASTTVAAVPPGDGELPNFEKYARVPIMVAEYSFTGETPQIRTPFRASTHLSDQAAGRSPTRTT